VVDDDLAVRELSAQVLIPSGYRVDTAEDGAAGWESLHAHNYDLLITDHNMPKISGVELIRKLRSAQMTLPVVLVSGDIPTEELDRNPSLQLAATLPKPFSPDELLRTVKQVLRATERAYVHTQSYFAAMKGTATERTVESGGSMNAPLV